MLTSSWPGTPYVIYWAGFCVIQRSSGLSQKETFWTVSIYYLHTLSFHQIRLLLTATRTFAKLRMSWSCWPLLRDFLMTMLTLLRRQDLSWPAKVPTSCAVVKFIFIRLPCSINWRSTTNELKTKMFFTQVGWGGWVGGWWVGGGWVV